MRWGFRFSSGKRLVLFMQSEVARYQVGVSCHCGRLKGFISAKTCLWRLSSPRIGSHAVVSNWFDWLNSVILSLCLSFFVYIYVCIYISSIWRFQKTKNYISQNSKDAKFIDKNLNLPVTCICICFLF